MQQRVAVWGTSNTRIHPSCAPDWPQPDQGAGDHRVIVHGDPELALVSRADVPGGLYEAVQVAVAIAPGFFVARHTHPGIESSFVREGAGTLIVAGQPDRLLKAGDSFLIPPELPHAVRNGDASTIVAATYIVEKGKPLTTPAKY